MLRKFKKNFIPSKKINLVQSVIDLVMARWPMRPNRLETGLVVVRFLRIDKFISASSKVLFDEFLRFFFYDRLPSLTDSNSVSEMADLAISGLRFEETVDFR